MTSAMGCGRRVIGGRGPAKGTDKVAVDPEGNIRREWRYTSFWVMMDIVYAWPRMDLIAFYAA